MLVLFEDPDLVATDEQRKEAVEGVGEYAMGLLSGGTLKGGAVASGHRGQADPHPGWARTRPGGVAGPGRA